MYVCTWELDVAEVVELSESEFRVNADSTDISTSDFFHMEE